MNTHTTKIRKKTSLLLLSVDYYGKNHIYLLQNSTTATNLHCATFANSNNKKVILFNMQSIYSYYNIQFCHIIFINIFSNINFTQNIVGAFALSLLTYNFILFLIKFTEKNTLIYLHIFFALISFHKSTKTTKLG